MKTYKSCPMCGAIVSIDSAYCGEVSCPKCKQQMAATHLKELPSIKIQCPQCQTRLISYNIKDNAVIRCSKCMYTALLSSFRTGAASVERPQPQPVQQPEYHQPAQQPVQQPVQQRPVQQNVSNKDEGTPLNETASGTVVNGGIVNARRILSLRLYKDADNSWAPGAMREFELHEGRQLIGKESAGSQATIKLPTNDRFLSRNHFNIDVQYEANRVRYNHTIWDNDSKNGTEIKTKSGAWIKIQQGNAYRLNEGDLIRVGHTILEAYFKPLR